jgi:predicted nucleotidyltransferase
MVSVLVALSVGLDVLSLCRSGGGRRRTTTGRNTLSEAHSLGLGLGLGRDRYSYAGASAVRRPFDRRTSGVNNALNHMPPPRRKFTVYKDIGEYPAAAAPPARPFCSRRAATAPQSYPPRPPSLKAISTRFYTPITPETCRHPQPSVSSAAVIYHGINIDADQIATFCRRHGIPRFSLFGSILRDDFADGSDIDVLIEFPGPSPSLLDLGGMQAELTAMFGRTVDLKTWGFIADHLRPRIERERRVQYAA